MLLSARVLFALMLLLVFQVLAEPGWSFAGTTGGTNASGARPAGSHTQSHRQRGGTGG